MNDKEKAAFDGYCRYLRGAGYQPHKIGEQPPPPKMPTPTPTRGSNVQKAEIPIIPKPLIELADECKERGNRLEIVNGKVYEVKRQLIGRLN